jgi:hypothetical protein
MWVETFNLIRSDSIVFFPLLTGLHDAQLIYNQTSSYRLNKVLKKWDQESWASSDQQQKLTYPKVASLPICITHPMDPNSGSLFQGLGWVRILILIPFYHYLTEFEHINTNYS